jgi:hypothetical protein
MHNSSVLASRRNVVEGLVPCMLSSKQRKNHLRGFGAGVGRFR